MRIAGIVFATKTCMQGKVFKEVYINKHIAEQTVI